MKYQKSVLPNGLRLITIPMPHVQSVTAFVQVAAGSRYEEKRINGISHFLEHMAFKGTKRRPNALAISTEIDGIGGEFNAFTSKDHTGYYIKAASKHLPLLLDVLSDMLLHSKFDEKEIEKEKGVIIEEINMYEDLPMRKVSEIFENLLYGDTKLGRDIAGTEEVIRSITRQDFLDYVGKFYGTENTVITIAGGIDEGQGLRVKGLVEEYFGNWKRTEAEKYDKVEEKQAGPKLLIRHKDTQQAHLCIGFRSFGLGHPDRYKMGLLTAILGGGMSSRLFIEVREKRGLAYYVRANDEHYQDTGHFVTQAGVDVDRIDDAIKVILEQFATAKDGRPVEQELRKAKEYLKGHITLELEDSRSVASIHSDGELLEGKIRTPEEILSEIDRVTVDDIQEMAKKYYTSDTLNLAVIGPYREEERFRKLLTF